MGWTGPALLVSAALNGVLGWLVLSQRDTSVVAPPSAPAEVAAKAKVTPATSSPTKPTEAAHERGTSAIRSCAEALAAAQVTIAKLEKDMPPSVRFEAGDPRDNAQEARIRDDLARVLDGVQYSLECRGAICKIAVVEKTEADSEKWMGPLQSDPAIRLAANSRELSADTPTKDPITGEALKTNDVYLGLNDVDASSGAMLLKGVTGRFLPSSELAACKSQAPGATGTLELKLSIEDGGRSIAIDAGGTLALTPVGDCIVAALGRATASVTIPPKVTSAVLFVPITLP